MLGSLGAAVVMVDVDADQGVRDRFGLRVPVLEIDGAVAMEGRFDEGWLARLVAARSSEP